MTLHDGWVSRPEFGSVEQFSHDRDPSAFYSHQYDKQGECDVMNAALAYMKQHADNDAQREVADFLLSKNGGDTDWWGYGGNERWVVRAQDYLDRAAELLDHMRTNKVEVPK